MAAGLGFKTFTTGEVLTAADTNGYLMQGVLVFASAAARDAAITSPQEGQCCYLKDTDAVLTYSGSAWVGFDDTNAIQNTIVDAKGDLIAASAADVPARLAVGNNGETLVADSAATTGLRYSATPSASNPTLNSAFQVWQRGTSISLAASASATYSADRWVSTTGANQATTISRQSTNDTTNLPNIQYCARFQRNSGQTGTSGYNFLQPFESINSIPFAGKTVTFSFYARAGANYSATSSLLNAVLVSGTGTDQNPFSAYTGASNVISQNATLTTTWQRFTYTGTVGSTATELYVNFIFNPTGTASTNDYYEVTGIQIDVGSVALPFRTYAATIQGELAACQRYYYRNYSTTSTNFGWFGVMGTGASSTSISGFINHPVKMRVTPTSLDFQNLSWITAWGAGVTSISNAVINTTGTTDSAAIITLTTTGATAGQLYYILSNNGNNYIGLSAEL